MVLCVLHSMSFSGTGSEDTIASQVQTASNYCSYLSIRLIRLSSPNLNYLLIIGMLLMYISGIAFVTPMTLPPVVSTICLVKE